MTHTEACMLSGMDGTELRLAPEVERLCEDANVLLLLEDRVSAHVHSAWIC